ncbi:hypothetical protein [Thalassobacillus pellis]|uniref:hypothetical protein n=1 Tax=Thalassobacillus pellis TaxID=748008 RepID=UPI001961213B|nr:hypothetical protein [Thalassobacillus pellis]MBM7554302.1 hypothetical protein [Thalassobacillus pellis]
MILKNGLYGVLCPYRPFLSLSKSLARGKRSGELILAMDEHIIPIGDPFLISCENHHLRRLMIEKLVEPP